MENKMADYAKTFYFMVVAVMMYYFLDAYIDVGLHVTFRHAFALVLFGSALLMFLYQPDIPKGFTAFKNACVYSIPLAVTTVFIAETSSFILVTPPYTVSIASGE